MREDIYPKLRQRAAGMRKSPTEPERRLWWALRHSLPLKDTHFRRQVVIDRAIVASLLPAIVADLRALGCDFRADRQARMVVPDLKAANDADFDTEWLDSVMSVAVVDGVDQALAHIARHGSEHTDAIITEDAAVADRFLRGVDSAVALWNASTQFCDGGEFGFGAEIGIATGRMHARGPVGLEQLTTYRYLVMGTGQVRP